MSVDPRIVTYYLLCATRSAPRHIVNSLSAENLADAITKKEVDLFLRKQDGYYVAKQVVIGGADALPTIRRDLREPVLVY